MRTLRRVVFYVFLAIYLVATPLTVLYALGYLYRPGAEHGLVRGGLISIDTEPAGARVYVGDRRFTRRTPTMIRGLLPGTYPIRLTLRHHEPWAGTVTVRPERATVLDRIILLPDSRQPQVLAGGPFDDLVAGPDALIVARGNRGEGLWAYTPGDEAPHPVLPTNSPLREAQVVERYVVEDSPYALLAFKDGGRESYMWCRLDRDDEPQDVTRLFPRRPERVLWDSRSKDEIFTLTDGQVDRLDLDHLAIYPGVLSHVLSLTVYRDHLYALDTSNHFSRFDRDGGDPKPAGKAPPEVRMFWGSLTGYALRMLNEDLALFLSDEGGLFLNRSPYLLAEHDIEGIVPLPRLKSALVWTGNRLGRLDYESRDDEGDSRQPRVLWIHEAADPIRCAAWADEGSHIVYSAGGRLYLLAGPAGGGPPARELARCSDREPFVCSDRTGGIYYLDEERRLVALLVLPRHELLPLPRAHSGDEAP